MSQDAYQELSIKVEDVARFLRETMLPFETNERRRASVGLLADTLSVCALILSRDLDMLETRGHWSARPNPGPCKGCQGLRSIYRNGLEASCERCGGTGIEPRIGA